MIDHFILEFCDRASFLREVYTTNKQQRMFSKMIKTDYKDFYSMFNQYLLEVSLLYKQHLLFTDIKNPLWLNISTDK